MVALAALVAASVVLGASASAAPVISVLTMTPGPRLFERFGHTAILVDDRVYNFGTFDGGDPQLVPRFLRHELSYWLSTQPYGLHREQYRNRITTVQRLALTDDEAELLAARLAVNALPENRAYRYDFFLDNCATRVRDAVDDVTDGAVKAGGGGPGVATYREQVESVLGSAPLVADGVSLLLSGFADTPTTRWQDAFLPRELESLLAAARRHDGRPLVDRTTVIAGDEIPAPPRASRAGLLLILFFFVPVLIAAAGGLRRRGAPSRAREVLGGAVLVQLGSCGGLLGTALLVANLTSYPCARGNVNLLLLHPALFALVPAGLRLIAGGARRGRTARAARMVLGASIALALCDLALRASGVTLQRNTGLALVVLALALLASLGLRGLLRHGPPAVEPPPG